MIFDKAAGEWALRVVEGSFWYDRQRYPPPGIQVHV